MIRGPFDITLALWSSSGERVGIPTTVTSLDDAILAYHQVTGDYFEHIIRKKTSVVLLTLCVQTGMSVQRLSF